MFLAAGSARAKISLGQKEKKKPISHPQTQREILPSQSLPEPQPKCNRADLVLQTTASWALFSHTQQAVTSADYLQETQLKPNPNTGSSDLFFPEGTGQAHLCVLKAPGHSCTHRAMQGLSSHSRSPTHSSELGKQEEKGIPSSHPGCHCKMEVGLQENERC